MENKQIKRIFTKLHKKLGRPMLDFELSNAQLDLSMLENHYDQLEKENAELNKHRGTDDTADAMIYASMMKQKHEIKELRKQLQAKDKALDKACEELVKRSHVFNPCPIKEYRCDEECRVPKAECWKEWCENE